MTETSKILPADILRFWRDAGPDRWFNRNDAFDAELKARFLPLWETAAAGHLSSWEETSDGALALVIVLDQFPRNMFRNDPRTYASDPLAREVARRAIDRGADADIEPELRSFFYLPFEHSEDADDQTTCVALFKMLGDAESLKWAEHHAEIIARFGRFPHRNRILNRNSTADEQSFLDSGGFSG
ncbi:DUF924 family protein [Bradyrhizobium prioriisuperbiae]|uniref:DUF924 family protein n=1 Tax=Bradyrhizobium prioriisuperbiae TaxID=2854389 RepID=UPI0028E37BE5|nr:DUF924 family protein [Bradyrhizobium prioritasuperba]